MTENTLTSSRGQQFSRISRRIPWGVLTRFLAISFLPSLFANSAAWMASNVNTSILPSSFQIAEAVLSPAGEIITASNGACQNPTVTWGSAGSFTSCISNFTSSGQPVFAIQLGGASINAIALDGNGNIYVSGDAGPIGAGFATTPGVYKPNPPGEPDPVLCKFSGVDGHAIFCTFADVSQTLAVDSEGNSYLAGSGVDEGTWVEKLNADASNAVYLTSPLNTPAPGTVGQFAIAVDASGNLYCISNGLVELNSAGTVVSSVLVDAASLRLALDSSGNPELLIQDPTSPGYFELRKYSAGLSAILFDTPPFYAGAGSSALSMAIDPSGVTGIIGDTPAINLAQVNPTQPCGVAGSAYSPNTFLVRIDANGNTLETTYLENGAYTANGNPQLAMNVSSTSASVLFWSSYPDPTTLLTLGPASATIALGCVGNAASYETMALAPNEIVSAFGTGLGPAVPATAQPDTNGLYPTQLGGIEITFDGVAAPLLYARSSQVNLVTPQELNGKTSTQVCAVLNNVSLNCITAAVQSAAPGIFTSGQLYVPTPYVGTPYNGTPYAAAVNQDGTINSEQNPAAPNSIISLYVTGLGAMTPSPPDGGITPLPVASQESQISAVFFEPLQPSTPGEWSPPVRANVLYAGPAPLEVEGLGQINVQVPQAVGPISFAISVVSPDGTQEYTSGIAVIWTQAQ